MVAQHFKLPRDFARVSYTSSVDELYQKGCFTKTKKIAVFEAEDRHKSVGRNVCPMVPTRSSYFETWIASAVKQGLQYKRSFDIGYRTKIDLEIFINKRNIFNKSSFIVIVKYVYNFCSAP